MNPSINAEQVARETFCGCYERFWNKIDKSSGCWLWIGTLDGKGYGFFKLNKKQRLAHQISWTFKNGSVPDGLVLDHICRVRNCVNPDHLRVITLVENVLCGQSPAAINSRKTHCKYGHEYTPENITHYPSNPKTRVCIKCVSRRTKLKALSTTAQGSAGEK